MKEQALALTGPDELLKQLTMTVVETGLDEDMSGHFGDEEHAAAGRQSGQPAQRDSVRTVLVETRVRIDIPRVREGTFAPASLQNASTYIGPPAPKLIAGIDTHPHRRALAADMVGFTEQLRGRCTPGL